MGLYRNVRAGFTLRGESLGNWCRVNGIPHVDGQRCLKGLADDEFWRARRGEIVQAAGLAPSGAVIRRRGVNLYYTVRAGLILRDSNFTIACAGIGAEITRARRALTAGTAGGDDEKLIRKLTRLAGVDEAGELLLPGGGGGGRQAA